jgi:hypothetical protein
MQSIQMEWIKDYTEKLIKIAMTFDGGSAMQKSVIQRVEYIMDMVQAFQLKDQHPQRPNNQPPTTDGGCVVSDQIELLRADVATLATATVAVEDALSDALALLSEALSENGTDDDAEGRLARLYLKCEALKNWRSRELFTDANRLAANGEQSS